jgi:hypothetical protein
MTWVRDIRVHSAASIPGHLPLLLAAFTLSMVNAQKSPAVRQSVAAYGNKFFGLRHTHLSGNTALFGSLDLIGDPLLQNLDGIRHYASPFIGAGVRVFLVIAGTILPRLSAASAQ